MFISCTAIASFVLSVGIVLQSSAAPSIFHVAPNGSDTNDGTKDRPFATLERARDAVRDRRAADNGEFVAVTVELRGGRHFRQTSFVLGEEDAGTPEARVVFRATKGETAGSGSTTRQLAPVASA